jgi:hypothetical protein
MQISVIYRPLRCYSWTTYGWDLGSCRKKTRDFPPHKLSTNSTSGQFYLAYITAAPRAATKSNSFSIPNSQDRNSPTSSAVLPTGRYFDRKTQKVALQKTVNFLQICLKMAEKWQDFLKNVLHIKILIICIHILFNKLTDSSFWLCFTPEFFVKPYLCKGNVFGGIFRLIWPKYLAGVGNTALVRESWITGMPNRPCSFIIFLQLIFNISDITACWPSGRALCQCY